MKHALVTKIITREQFEPNHYTSLAMLKISTSDSIFLDTFSRLASCSFHEIEQGVK